MFTFNPCEFDKDNLSMDKKFVSSNFPGYLALYNNFFFYFRESFLTAIRKYNINNYNYFSHKGKSSAFTGFLAGKLKTVQ